MQARKIEQVLKEIKECRRKQMELKRLLLNHGQGQQGAGAIAEHAGTTR
jgi:Mg2+ and Co2+ transporter CorA